ncbi:GTPase-associated system all-helical protein GASH [Bradyrhizobium yuanmingense]|uniref:GTPase-associated system all-helical protein GASH n=1 Tax=Bradyrhizobium yuanmingense TaxID=108015 RepID=UPI0023B916EE|nr:GTPase-associated system all-helical protein GASH [Bradyrhizobium yuanmingense]MDF0515765.1 GTPase-associated system all-helical protein GASH [Bradyrhizobium yuanmingense]
MTDNVLLRFLTRGLIDVGGDDAKLDRLGATAADLARVLESAPAKAIPFALIAFDPQAPAGDPVVKEVLEILQQKWTTYVNTFSGTPVGVVRALLLDALAQAAKNDDRIGAAFVASARNTLPLMEAGHEQEIWDELVREIEARIDARAEAEWATPASIVLPALDFEFSAPEPGQPKRKPVDREALKAGIRAASGPQYQNAQGAQATNGNPQWPANNQAWVTEFGERLAKSIADAVDVSVGSLVLPEIDLSEPLQTLAGDVAGHVDQALNAVSAATAGLQRRANLLWWKEARYSPSAQASYRELSPRSAATLMAFDMQGHVPVYSPASVPAFLFEAVIGLPTIEAKRSYGIFELVDDAQKDDRLSSLREKLAKTFARPAGRTPVLSLIAYPDLLASKKPEDFRRLTGVPAETELTLPQWSTWVFRELQGAAATTLKAEAKAAPREAPAA